MSPSSTMPYRADIDGLRGLSILAVVLFHAGLGFPGGYVGVDVFFVISGFLITSLILQQKAEGTFRLREFWGRRIRRLLPASSVMTAVTLLVGCLLLIPSDLDQLATSAFAQQFFVSNVYFYLISDYFAAPSELMPLMHTWSLSVEEQFYLLFPIAMVGLLWCGRLVNQWALIVIAGLSFGACVLVTVKDQSAAFFLMPTRAWELGAGSLLSLGSGRGVARQIRGPVAGVCLIGLIACSLWFDDQLRFPGAYALVPVICTAGLIWGNSEGENWVKRLLSARPIVFVGLVSYSLYLWHWPILAYANHLLDHLNLGARVGLAFVSFLVAVASWKWIEQPYRRRDARHSRNRFMALGLAITSVVFASLWIAKSNGLPNRMSPEANRVIAETRIKNQSLAAEEAAVVRGEIPVLGVKAMQPEFLVWGDSHALAASDTIDHIANEVGTSGYLVAFGGYPPLLDMQSLPSHAKNHERIVAWNRATLNLIRDQKIKNVIMVSAWRNHFGGEPEGLQAGIETRDRLAASVLADGLTRTVLALEKAGVRVWILMQPPVQPFHVGKAVRNQVILGWPRSIPEGCSREQFMRASARLRPIFEIVRSPQVVIIDPVDQYFDQSGRATPVRDGKPLYIDTNHLSSLGAATYFGESLSKILAEIRLAASQHETSQR